jgi:hypothetical protein
MISLLLFSSLSLSNSGSGVTVSPCDAGMLKELQYWCYTVVTLLLHCGHAVITLLSYCCYTTATRHLFSPLLVNTILECSPLFPTSSIVILLSPIA